MGRPKSQWQLRLEEYFARGFIKLFQALPHRTALAAGAGVGGLFHDLAGVRREHAVRELRRAFPERSEAWAKATARQVYRHFGMVAVELARLPKLRGAGLHRWVIMEGVEHLESAAAAGRGTLVISGHLGNWELGGAWVSNAGYPATYVVAPQSNSRIEELLDELRRSAGIEIVKRRDATRQIMKALRRGRFVALLIDQDGGPGGEFVPFFGRLASTFRGVAVFARKMRPAIIFYSSYRDKEGRIHGRFEPVEFIPTDDMEADIHNLTADLTARLEAEIRRTPEQWLWLHRRWKTRPPGETAGENKMTQ